MDAARLLLVLTVAGAISNPSRTVAQSPAQPAGRTANFAGQSAWSGTNTTAPPAAAGYDRYGQPITSSAATITGRAQSAFTETGTALRDGVEAGIRAANQQISSSNPFAAATTTPVTNTGSASGVSAPPWSATPSATSAPPSWASNPASSGAPAVRSASGPMAMEGGWTSIGTSIAAPPLLIPQSPMTITNFGNVGATTNRNGPNYPVVASNDQQPLHSVLAEPARPSTPATTPATTPANDWASGWNNNTVGQPVTIGRAGSQPSLGSTVRESDLVPLPSNAATVPDPRSPAAGRTSAGWADTDAWTQPAQPTLGTPSATIGSAGASKPVATNGVASTPFGNQPIAQPTSGPTMGNFNTAVTNPNSNPLTNGANQNVRGQAGGNTTNESQPWMPMVAAVLTLAGSLAANLFLGMSYLDARQKYQSLVRKTADTFRRVKAVAA